MRFVLWVLWSGAGIAWAQDHDHDHDHDHGHDHDQTSDKPEIRTGCEAVPQQALTMLEAHYSAKKALEAHQQQWAEDWGGAVFSFQSDKTRCFPWNEDWLIYAHGGSYQDKVMMERHRWVGSRLLSDGPTAPPLRVEVEEDVPLLRVDTKEGCCDTRWTQASWYSNRKGGMHRVASVPVAIDSGSTLWPVHTTAIWSGKPWAEGEEATGPYHLSLRYVVPNLGNRETVMRGRIQDLGGSLEWIEPGDSGLADGLSDCVEKRIAFCPLRVLSNWVSHQASIGLPTKTNAPRRSVTEIKSHVRLESVKSDGGDIERIRSVIRSRQNQVLACYERATRDGAVLSGPLIVTLDVESGRVVAAEVNAAPDHAGFVSCVRKRLPRLRFPTGTEAAVYVTWAVGSAD